MLSPMSKSLTKCDESGISGHSLNTPSNLYGLAIVQTFQLGKSLLISLHEISQLIDESGTLEARDIFPPGFAEGLPRSRNCDVDISLGG